MKYRLLNFDHGMKHPDSINIGPFKILITEKHCQNALHIPRDEQIKFSYDKEYKHVIRHIPKISGSWIETAEVKVDPKDLQPSVIFPETNPKQNIDDLCLFLSFVTGRFVSLDNNPFLNHFNPERHVDKIVYYGYLSQNDFNWQQLENIRKYDLCSQFYYLIIGYQSYDLISQIVHCNNTINVAYEKWQKYYKINFIEKKVQSKINNSIKKCLDKNNVENKIKEDILRRINNIYNPSAIIKLRHFLIGIDVYPKYDNPEIYNRLKWLNYVRNSMVHSGVLTRDNKLSTKILNEIIYNIASLVLRINQYYLGCKILNIDDPYLRNIKKQIKSYFLKGTFEGMKVFHETYEEYMERAKNEWLEENLF